jgi:flavin reductase (DIM6/NTAB) family NADH-FMN oxidoreductase RutF
MAIALEVVLVSGERRTVSLPVPAGSLANALARLDDWIPTDDGGWVQKSFIVEVRRVERDRDMPRGSAVEFERLSDAAETLTDQGQG